MPDSNQSGLSDSAASGLAYVTIIPAIIFLIVEPFNKNRTVRFHSWQSIFLGIAWFAANVVMSIIGRMPVIRMLDIFLWPVVSLGFFVLWLILIVNAFNGKRFAVPYLSDLAEKQAAA